MKQAALAYEPRGEVQLDPPAQSGIFQHRAAVKLEVLGALLLKLEVGLEKSTWIL